MITDVEEFFAKGCGRCARFATADCSTRAWQAGLARLRAICLTAGLSEVAKWGHPCYMHAGRNIAIIGALRGDFRLGFMEAGLLADPDGILERQGEMSARPSIIRFTANDQPARMEAQVLAYLAEAMAHAEAGRRAPQAPQELTLPDELVEALDADPDLAEAFNGLTPGRQRSYVLLLASAKTPATRTARIGRNRDRILAGKGANER